MYEYAYAPTSTPLVMGHDVMEESSSLEPPLPENWGRLAGIMLSARLIAGRNNANEIRPEHLLLAILDKSPIEDSSRSAVKALELPESTIAKLRQEIEESDSSKSIQYGDLPFSTSSRSLIDEAGRLARARQQHADGLYLLLALLSHQSLLRDKLIGAGINRDKVEYALQNKR